MLSQQANTNKRHCLLALWCLGLLLLAGCEGSREEQLTGRWIFFHENLFRGVDTTTRLEFLAGGGCTYVKETLSHPCHYAYADDDRLTITLQSDAGAHEDDPAELMVQISGTSVLELISAAGTSFFVKEGSEDHGVYVSVSSLKKMKKSPEFVSQATDMLQTETLPGQTVAILKNQLAWLYATEPGMLNGSLAVEYGEEITRAYPDSDRYFDTLAAAYARDGQYEKAADAEIRAIALARGESRRAHYRKFLKRYINKQPYTEHDPQ